VYSVFGSGFVCFFCQNLTFYNVIRVYTYCLIEFSRAKEKEDVSAKNLFQCEFLSFSRPFIYSVFRYHSGTASGIQKRRRFL